MDPWPGALYWQTFPVIQENLRINMSGTITVKVENIPIWYPMSKVGDPKNIKIVLNSYARPFLIYPHLLVYGMSKTNNSFALF